MAWPQDVAELDKEVCEHAEKFYQIYYDHYDKDRKRLSEMYTKSACLLWNGNPVEGQAKIGEFLTTLPPTEHKIRTVDSQAVTEKVTGGHKVVMVQVSGNCKMQLQVKHFVQSFVLMVEDGKWRIVSDRFRYVC